MVGAVYCVYDDSGFLEESINRVYSIVDKILVLLNVATWHGQIDFSVLEQTHHTLLKISDTEHKIAVITQHWNNEADQRNFGTKYLRENNIDWAMQIDDDELYNTNELKKVFDSLNLEEFSVYLFRHQVYWKDRKTIVDFNACNFPTIISTKPNIVYFNFARTLTVYEGKKWYTTDPTVCVCHHMSYVRSDEKMLRKLQSFSHAKDITYNWYENVWLKWHEGMENLHPTNPSEFRKAMSAENSIYRLT